MQSKGAIRLVAILLAIACLWQLSFTAVTKIHEKKAVKYAENVAAAFQNSPAFNKVAVADQAYVLDSIRADRNRWYTDSISNEKVYFGYTFKDVKAKEINLGLDLKGGMNVMLQVQLSDLVKALSENNQTPEFLKAIDLAKERSVNSQSDFITNFGEAWKEVSGGQRLAQIFGTYEMRDRIKPESTDEEVLSVIKSEAQSAIDNSYNVLRNRIDRFGVTQPSISRVGNTGRILVELPGVKEPERVRNLLQGTASLEFWTTFTFSEIYPYLVEANTRLAEMMAAEETPASETEEAEKPAESSVVEEVLAEQQNDSADQESYRKANPLFAVLQPSQMNNNACIGFANAVDMDRVMNLLSMPGIADIFPAEFRPMWSVKPTEYISGGNVYELVAIKSSSRDGKAPLDGGVVTDARVDYNAQQHGGHPGVSMSMNAEGANIWARLTKENIGRQVAIVLDGAVYSYPTVQSEISGGNSSITGNFDIDEATEAAETSVVDEVLAEQKNENSGYEDYKKANPLFAVLQPSQMNTSAWPSCLPPTRLPPPRLRPLPRRIPSWTRSSPSSRVSPPISSATARPTRSSPSSSLPR